MRIDILSVFDFIYLSSVRINNLFHTLYMFRSGYSRETVELSIVQILVLVARSLTEIILNRT